MNVIGLEHTPSHTLFVIRKKNGQVEEPNLVFVAFVLLTYPECFTHADCIYGTCTKKGLCKCEPGRVKKGRTCKGGKNIFFTENTVKS